MENIDEEATVPPTSEEVLSDLRGLSIRCREQLHQLSTDDRAATRAEAKETMASFNIWMANIGVFREGRQSLDSRLKNAPQISKLVQALLMTLIRELGNRRLPSKNGWILTSGTEDALKKRDDEEESLSASESDDSSDRSSSSAYRLLLPSDDDEALTPISPPPRPTIWTAIQDTITRLCQIALTVQVAGAHHRQERIQSFKNSESRRQVYQLIERYARQKVDHLFPNASEILRERMAESIATRRARFMYLELHYQKKISPSKKPAPFLEQNVAPEGGKDAALELGHQQTTTALPHEQGDSRQSVKASGILSNTVVTELDLKQVAIKARRAESVTSIKISTGTFPSMPKPDPGGFSFTCPYCFLICPVKEYSGQSQWRSHLTQDFEPFFCVYDNCFSPFSCSDTYNGWLAHMRDTHTEPEWHCLYCEVASSSFGPFSTPSDLESHLKEHHREEVSDALYSTLLKHSVTRNQHALQECPFCDGLPEEIEKDHPNRDHPKAREALGKHVRDHLVSVALILAPVEGSEAGSGIDDTKSEAPQRDNASDCNPNEVGDIHDMNCPNGSCDCKDIEKDSVLDWSTSPGHQALETKDMQMMSTITQKWREISYNKTRDEGEDEILPDFARKFRIAQGETSTMAYEDYTIAWVCALPLELAASRAMLDEEHRPLPTQGNDANTYVLGSIGQHNIVMACLPGEYERNNAAIAATNLKRSFPNIRATLMVGIGGGSPRNANMYLGDVVVGTRMVQYDMGRMMAEGQFRETEPAQPLLSAVSVLQSKHRLDTSSTRITSLLQAKFPKNIRPSQTDRLFQSTYEHPDNATSCDKCNPEKLEPRPLRSSGEPRVHYGVIASSNMVMKNGIVRDDIAQRLSALCFEMEATSTMEIPKCLPIRGICDYADSHKNEEWQQYAAATAAAYARELLEVPSHSVPEPSRKISSLANMSKPKVTGNVDSERQKRLLESLYFPQLDSRMASIKPAHTRTCRWFLHHSAYRDWLDPASQSNNHGFLWMRCKPGAGKSTMMKFAFLNTKREFDRPDTTVASFFFNARGDYLEKSIIGMFRSLLIQLLEGFTDLQWVLTDPDIVPLDQQDCPDLNLLKNILKSAVMVLGHRSFTCFIDALDECDEQEVRDMVQVFEELAKKTTEIGIQFRICLSSRHYPSINIRRGITFTLEDEEGHREDLAQYVKSRLKITNSSLFAELQTQILEKAAGTFIWVVLVVEILNQEISRGALALRKRISEIPTALSDFFKSMLTRDRERAEWLLLCVLWILCAQRPLSPAEFRHALWAGLLEQDLVDQDLPDATDMDACAKLITISSKGLAEILKSTQPTVQFIHESVRDFLVGEKGLLLLWSEPSFEWEARSHERLRRCCTAYLNHPRAQTAIKTFQDGNEDKSTTAELCFLEYASQQVLHHANAAALVISQDDFLDQFFAADGVQAINLFEKFKSRRYNSGVTPIYVLADRGLENLVRTRMKRESAGFVPGEKYEHPFFAALANGHSGTVSALLGLPSHDSNGVDIMEGLKHGKDFTDYQGRTPLSWAAQEGRLIIVKVLIQRGASPDEKDRKGYSPLIRALENHQLAVAVLLLEQGADVNAQSERGRTPLIVASQTENEALVQLLVERGAKIDFQDDSGSTALIEASRHGYMPVVRLLIEKGADCNFQNDSRSTALIEASRNGYMDVVQLLIGNGADINSQDENGCTARDEALKYGHEDLARLFEG